MNEIDRVTPYQPQRRGLLIPLVGISVPALWLDYWLRPEDWAAILQLLRSIN